MSIEDLKNLPRKQQELVLAVWDKVLKTVKWQQATKTDFMADTEYPDMLGPKDTPFDVALGALKEIIGAPKYFHGCPGCIFLETVEEGEYTLKSPHYDKFEHKGPFDLYYCRKGGGPKQSHVTVRFKDAPKPTDRAYSITHIMTTDFGQDDGYLSCPTGLEEYQEIFKLALVLASKRNLL